MIKEHWHFCRSPRSKHSILTTFYQTMKRQVHFLHAIAHSCIIFSFISLSNQKQMVQEFKYRQRNNWFCDGYVMLENCIAYMEGNILYSIRKSDATSKIKQNSHIEKILIKRSQKREFLFLANSPKNIANLKNIINYLEIETLF